ncbi:ketohydroxyglutarate aldolase [Scytonema sp. PCC 10023]|uniref:ketohydroxyglutarate aldolase n=1 Tax=Scytonema sp. PCC 10023 TaxID=1680591 RepID=UPI0039C6CDBC
MSQVNLVISVDDEHKNQILEVMENLQAIGMKVEQSMPQIGVIVGSIDSTKVEEVSAVEGVAAVETSRSFQIAPPESDIQ